MSNTIIKIIFNIKLNKAINFIEKKKIIILKY